MREIKLCKWSFVALGVSVGICIAANVWADTGLFIDSPVQGLHYKTDTYSGVTSAKGTFQYSLGEDVNFYLGDPDEGGVLLGSAYGKKIVTPIDLVPGAIDEKNQRVTNISRFLQSLDVDGDLNNGITISQSMSQRIIGTSLDFDQDTEKFGEDSTVEALLTSFKKDGFYHGTNIANGKLRSVAKAQAHLRNTLAARIVVNTESGQIAGYAHDQRVWTWKAVPYAKPPVGDLRWRAPQPPEKWNGRRDAVDPASPATQLYTSLNWVRSKFAVGSEDCLRLDIYSPRTDDDIKTLNLPVYFWIHGGSNNMGSADAHYNRVEDLVARGNMIGVVIQYRLGPLGWFNHPALKTGDPLDDSGNFGLLDQIMALRWVQSNIAAFGGDPNNVTVAGNSAGARNTNMLVMSPLAKGLFHKAVSESGRYNVHSVDKGIALAEKTIANIFISEGFAQDTAGAKVVRDQMTDESIESYLRSKSNQEILEALAGRIGGYTHYGDGHTLPSDVLSKVKAREYNQVPIILGTNEYEGTGWNWKRGPKVKLAKEKGGWGFADAPSSNYTWADLMDVLEGKLALEDVLVTEVDKKVWSLSAYHGALKWKAGAVDSFARELIEKQKDVYVYYFKWGGPGARPEPFASVLRSVHALEIPFFHGQNVSPWNYTLGKENKAGWKDLQGSMMSYLEQFAKTGNPNKEGLPMWSQWSNEEGGPKSLIFDADYEKAKITMMAEEITSKKINALMEEATSDLPESIKELPLKF